MRIRCCLLASVTLVVTAVVVILAAGAGNTAELTDSRSDSDIVFRNRSHGFDAWSTRLKVPGRATSDIVLTDADVAHEGRHLQVVPLPERSDYVVAVLDEGALVATCSIRRYETAMAAKRALSFRLIPGFNEIAAEGGNYDVGDVSFYRTWMVKDDTGETATPWTEVLFARNNVVAEVHGTKFVMETARSIDGKIVASLVVGAEETADTGAKKETPDILDSTIDDVRDWADKVRIEGKRVTEVRLKRADLEKFGGQVIGSAEKTAMESISIFDADGARVATIGIAVFDTSRQAKRALLGRRLFGSMALSRAEEDSAADLGDVSFYGTYVEGKGNPEAAKRRRHNVVFARNNVTVEILEYGDEIKVAPFVDAKIVEALVD